MLKKNYAAWHINDNEFSESLTDIEKLRFFTRYAVLAPSGHNSQPWEVLISNGSLLVKVNKARHLSVDGSGLLSVEPYISIGTFLETLSLAGAGFGYKVDIQLLPKHSIVAELRLGDQVQPQPELLTAIKTRVSNRNSYLRKPVEPNVLKQIVSYPLPGIAASPIIERSDIAFVARQTETAIESIMSKPLYRKELSTWVRTNQTRKYDGMPGFTHGFGHVKSLVSRIAVRHGPKHGPQAKKSSKLILDSGALIILRCTEESKEAFINAGRFYARACVLASNTGIATSALGAAVLDPVTRDIIRQRFAIKDRPIYILRLGEATTRARHSPRWPLERILSS